MVTGEEPGHVRAARMLHDALWQLRAITAPAEVTGAAAHGDALCAKWDVHNNDLWLETGGEHALATFGLEYEAYILHSGMHYLSDNHGKWHVPLEHNPPKTSMVLIHPCHWDIDAATEAGV